MALQTPSEKLKISWKDKVSRGHVLRRIEEEKLHFILYFPTPEGWKAELT